MLDRNSSVASDDSPRDVDKLAEMEAKLSARLALLDRLKAVDLHTAAWTGDAGLVNAHLEQAAANGSRRAARELRAAERQLKALEREAASMNTKRQS